MTTAPDPTAPPANGTPATENASPPAPTQDQPDWAKTLAKQVNDLKAEIGRLKTPDREPPKTGKEDAPAPKGIDPVELDSLIECRAILRAMSSEAREKAKPLIEGLPSARQLQILEALTAQGNGQANADPNPTPASGGRPPTPPTTRPGVAHPKSLREAIELSKSDPARWQALKKDPTFDITKIPQI